MIAGSTKKTHLLILILWFLKDLGGYALSSFTTTRNLFAFAFVVSLSEILRFSVRVVTDVQPGKGGAARDRGSVVSDFRRGARVKNDHRVA